MKRLFVISLILCDLEADMSHSLSSQGFTGLINTPNAQVLDQGDLTFHYDNQFDNSLRGYDYDRAYTYQEDYIFGVGLFPYFELQGRLSESRGYHRDLSGNMKLKLPYSNKYLPDLAVGIQDLGGGANHYGNYYAVLDKEFWFIRTSIGYGHALALDKSKQRMDGLFGGLEVAPFEWLHLLAEHDAKENFAAIRLGMPKTWSSYFKLDTTLSSNLSDDYKTSISVNLSFALYENSKNYDKHGTNLYRQEVYKEDKQNKSFIVDETEIVPDVIVEKNTIREDLTFVEIENKLHELGLENIVMATKESTLYIGYENNVFLFNDLDALGIVIGLMSKTQYKSLRIEQKRSKVVVISLSGDLEKAKLFYEHPSSISKEVFTATLQKEPVARLEGYTLHSDNVNGSSFKLIAELAPKVTTFIGNEFGLFTYKVWLRTKLQMNLMKGLDITAVGDIHIYDSPISDHRYDYFLKLYENDSHIESVMLHQSNNIFGGINTFSLGTFEENYAGVMEQYIYNLQNHTFRLKAGYFEQFKDGDPYKEGYLGKFDVRDIYLLKYSYLLDTFDTLGEFQAGKYWNQDYGFDIKVKRYFSDVGVYLSYEHSRANTVFSEQTDKYIGLGLEVPLTLKHTPMMHFGQIRGTNAFNYRIRSTVARDDGSNTIVPGGNYDPEVAISSDNYFYNRNRLQLSYIKEHAFRLIESYKDNQ